VSHLTTPEILGVLKKIEVRGISDTAHRVRSTCLCVLRYAARTGRPHSCLAALKLAPYLFVRPGELRMMEHSELNLDAAEWRIPGARM
jgi:hypothetical protein